MTSATEAVNGKGGTSAGETLAAARACIQSAKFAEAERLLAPLSAQDADPHTTVEVLYALAVARRYQGNHSGALNALDELLAINPDYSRACQEYGHTCLAANDPESAISAYKRAVELNPGLAASWRALAGLHDRAGRDKQARFAKTQADYLASLPPELAGVIDLLHEGKLYKAESVCRDFLQKNRQHVEGMRLLADIGVRLRVYDDAEFLLESCIEFEPDNARARADYLKVLNRKGKFGKAYEQAEILVSRYPDSPAFKLSLASALAGLGRYDEAIERYRACLDESPNKAGVHVLMGHAFKAIGALDEAVDSYRTAYQLRPDYGDAFWSLANTKTYRFTDDEIKLIEDEAEQPRVSAEDRIHLCFAAGKAYEDREDFASSFGYYERGNALKMARSGYDPERTSRMVDAQIETCTADLFERLDDAGCDSPDPIFIVGMPRAGSTLLEQILASHSMVDGTMELHNILALAQRLGGRAVNQAPRYPHILAELDASYFRRFGEQFIDDTHIYRGNASFFIDKMPNNFMHVGLIRLILPRAKIIDARRHPMACCFSGFKQLFGEGQDFTYGLESIGQYYRDYVRLMDHWDDVLPGFVLRVRHEDVVDDLETEVRRLLDFCELPFEESCLDFYRSNRIVRTPSSEQVRQPIYRSGLDQWRHYEDWLDPLKAVLGADIRRRFDIDDPA